MFEEFLTKASTILAKDKLLHMVGGYLLYITIMYLLLITNLHLLVMSITSTIFVAFTAFIKEIYDHEHKNHTADIVDFTATISLPILTTVFIIVYTYLGESL